MVLPQPRPRVALHGETVARKTPPGSSPVLRGVGAGRRPGHGGEAHAGRTILLHDNATATAVTQLTLLVPIPPMVSWCHAESMRRTGRSFRSRVGKNPQFSGKTCEIQPLRGE